MKSVWTQAELDSAKERACIHADLDTFPTVGSLHRLGFEVCPYCGAYAPMLVKFIQVGSDKNKAVINSSSGEHRDDLVYLAHLTGDGVKPLSRAAWELTADQVQFLTELGLHVSPVRRVALNGNVVVHWVFSRSERIIQEYCDYFGGKSLLRTPMMIRQEGRFFGIPQCCIEFYLATEGNDPPIEYSTDDLALLYYFPCRGCKHTPQLLPWYRAIYQQLNQEV